MPTAAFYDAGEKYSWFHKKLLTKPKGYFIINHVVTDAEIAQLVEHNLAKVGVAGFFVIAEKPF